MWGNVSNADRSFWAKAEQGNRYRKCLLQAIFYIFLVSSPLLQTCVVTLSVAAEAAGLFLYLIHLLGTP